MGRRWICLDVRSARYIFTEEIAVMILESRYVDIDLFYQQLSIA